MKNILLALICIFAIGIGSANAAKVIVGPGGVYVGPNGYTEYYSHYPRWDRWARPHRYAIPYGRPYLRVRPGVDFYRPSARPVPYYWNNRVDIRTPGVQLYIR